MSKLLIFAGIIFAASTGGSTAGGLPSMATDTRTVVESPVGASERLSCPNGYNMYQSGFNPPRYKCKLNDSSTNVQCKGHDCEDHSPLDDDEITRRKHHPNFYK